MMPPVTRFPGLAPAITFIAHQAHLIYGIAGGLLHDTVALEGTLLSSTPLPGGYFDAFPRADRAWVVYKRGGDWQPMAYNLITGQSTIFSSTVAGGNWPVCLDAARNLIAWQDDYYRIWISALDADTRQDTGQIGAPDGLHFIDGNGTVVLRKDTRLYIPGMTYPMLAPGFVCGEGQTGLATQLSGDRIRVAIPGNCPTPQLAFDPSTSLYGVVTGGPEGVRAVWGPSADYAALPPDVATLPVPPLAKSACVGFFHFPSPLQEPGNVSLDIASGGALLDRTTGHKIAQYVAGASENDIDSLDAAIRAARAKEPTMSLLAYWTRTAQTGRLPVGADLIGVEAYKLSTESLDAFAARVRASLVRCPASILIAQCYTSNDTLTTDLAPLVPVFSQLCKDTPTCLGVIAFSGYGRATGYGDHPEVHDEWTQLAHSSLGVPPLPHPVTPPDPPTPHPPVPHTLLPWRPRR